MKQHVTRIMQFLKKLRDLQKLTYILLTCIISVIAWHSYIIKSYTDEVMRNRFVNTHDGSLLLPSYSMPLPTYYNFKKEELKKYFKKKNTYTDSKVEKIEVFIEPTELSKLESDLPKSGKEYRPAKILYKSKKYDGKIRYRGLNPYHWNGIKKSYKIKINNTDLDQPDAIQLSNIKNLPLIHSYLADKIAEDFDIITPRSEFIMLYINNTYAGIYLSTESLNEEFLQTRNLPDGDIYNARNLNEYLTPHLPTNIYKSPYTWERTYISEPDKDPLRANLTTLTATIQSILEGREVNKALYEILDREYFVKFTAWLTAIQSPHLDYFHNNVLYFNEEKKLFYMIPSDSGGFERLFGPHIVSNDLLLALHRDPLFVHDKNKAVYKRFINKEYPQKIIDTFNQYIEEIDGAVKNDPNIANVYAGLRMPLTYKKFIEEQTDVINKMQKYNQLIPLFQDNLGAYSLKKNSDDTYKLVISAENYAGFTFTGLKFATECRTPLNVYRDINRNNTIDAGETNIGDSFNETLYSGLAYVKKRTLYQEYNMFMPPAPLHYHYIITTSCALQEPHVKNLLSQEEFGLHKIDAHKPETSYSTHPWNK